MDVGVCSEVSKMDYVKKTVTYDMVIIAALYKETSPAV